MIGFVVVNDQKWISTSNIRACTRRWDNPNAAFDRLQLAILDNDAGFMVLTGALWDIGVPP